MSKAMFIATWLLVGTVWATMGQAASPEDSSDARCIMVGLLMKDSPDAKLQAASKTVVYYFLGRLDGREPALDLESLMVMEAESWKPEMLKPEAERCGALLRSRGAALQAVGQAMAKQGSAQSDVEKPPAQK